MTRFVVGNSEYVVKFAYKQKDNITPLRLAQNNIDPTSLDRWDGKYPALTVCTIHCGPIGSRDAEKAVISTGLAYQHKLDKTCNKEIARRVSLTMATSKLEKPISSEAWAKYRARKSK